MICPHNGRPNAARVQIPLFQCEYMERLMVSSHFCLSMLIHGKASAKPIHYPSVFTMDKQRRVDEVYTQSSTLSYPGCLDCGKKLDKPMKAQQNIQNPPKR